MSKLQEFLALVERRRNPDQNPRISAVEFLRQYKDNPKMYLHTAPIRKVGINPRTTSSQDSPLGIYAYRLMDIWEDSIERWNTGEYKRGLEFLPYHGGDHLFILESDIDPNFPGDYTAADLERDVMKLQEMFRISDEDMKGLRRTARTNQNFRDCPAGYLWGITKAIVAGVDEFDEYTPVNIRQWATVLRRLGYVGFNDPGYGLIHGAEGAQALFLTTRAFRVVDYMLKNQRQPSVRMPRDLHMQGIPNTLFYNYKPDDFRKVRRWTVEGIDIHDFKGFIRFLPWNAEGIIGTLTTGSSDVFSSVSDIQKFLAHPQIPSNVKIKDLYIGQRYPMLMLDKISPDFPVEKITTHPFGGTHGFDRLPQSIRDKLVITNPY